MEASERPGSAGNVVKLVLAWSFVGIPLAWGVAQTLSNAMKLFQ
jgi:predicted phosphoribosyltransferase